MSIKEFSADRLAAEINQANNTYIAKVWRKHGLERVYVNCKDKTIARIDYTPKGVQIMFGMSWADIISFTQNDPDYKSDEVPDSTIKARTIKEIQNARFHGGEFTQEETERVLDTWYGKDNWDDRDRIDFEG